MIEISAPALIVTLQALARQAASERALLEELDEDDPAAAALSLSLADLDKTLNELRGAYEKARAAGYDLPPAERLLP